MKQFQEYKDLIYSLIKENDNYIIFNDGKAIRSNFNNEDDVEILVDNTLTPSEICGIDRCNEEDEILSKANFNTNIHLNNDIDLKVIYLNDDEDNLGISFEVKRDVKASITNIFMAVTRETKMVFDYSLSDNANLNVINFANYKNNVIEYNNYYLDNKATLELANLSINASTSKAVNNVYLYSEKASCVINNSCINTSSLKQSNNFNIHHLAKRTSSELIGYGLCKNVSSLDMNTNGIIKNGASKSSIFQKSKGILLDLESSVAASPLLQIDEYDCMATHGASVGAIDEADLFYLMSRGLDRATSEGLIVNGFFNPFLSKIDDEDIKNYIGGLIRL